MTATADLLADAYAAYHRLQTGAAAAEIRDSSGESIRYTAANVSRLWAYIRLLEAEVAGTAVVKPLRPTWC
jgi:hypothetical protein